MQRRSSGCRAGKNWFLSERDHVTFGYMLLLIHLCVLSVYASTQPVEIFGNIYAPFCTLAIHWPSCNAIRADSLYCFNGTCFWNCDCCTTNCSLQTFLKRRIRYPMWLSHTYSQYSVGWRHVGIVHCPPALTWKTHRILLTWKTPWI